MLFCAHCGRAGERTAVMGLGSSSIRHCKCIFGSFLGSQLLSAHVYGNFWQVSIVSRNPSLCEQECTIIMICFEIESAFLKVYVSQIMLLGFLVSTDQKELESAQWHLFFFNEVYSRFQDIQSTSHHCNQALKIHIMDRSI